MTAAGETLATDPKRWLSLWVVLTATFMSVFDFFVVNVAASSIARDLRASASSLELIVAGYGFTYALGLVTGGRLGTPSAGAGCSSRAWLPLSSPRLPAGWHLALQRW